MTQQWYRYGGYAMLLVGVGLIILHFVRPGLHALISGVIVVISGAILLVVAGRQRPV